MEKNTNIIIFIVVVFVVVGGFFFLKNYPGSVTPIEVNKDGEYTCPPETSCWVSPVLNCTTSSKEQKVYLRCGDTWFAYDPTKTASTLTYYGRVGGTTHTQVSSSTFVATCPDGSSIYKFGETYFYKQTSGTNYGVMSAPNSILVQKAPLSGYSELYEVADAYSCSGVVTINGIQRDVISKSDYKKFVYSPSQPYQLNPGDKFNFVTPTGYSKWRIIPTETAPDYKCDTPVGAVSSGSKYCDGNKLMKCTWDLAAGVGVVSLDTDCTLTGRTCDVIGLYCKSPEQKCDTSIGRVDAGTSFCEQDSLVTCKWDTTQNKGVTDVRNCASENKVCDSITKICKAPYTATLYINGVEWKSETNPGTIDVTAGSEIEVKLVVDDVDKTTKRTTKAEISNGDYDTDISNLAVKIIKVNAPLETGFSTLTVTMIHPKGNFVRSIEIHTVSNIDVSLTTDNPIQYDDALVQVKVNTMSDGQSIYVDDFEYEAKFRNQVVTATTKTQLQKGIYLLKFDVKGSGTLRVRARALLSSSANLWTQWSDYKDVNVVQSSITINDDFVMDVDTGSHLNRFSVTNDRGELVDVTSKTVIINKPLSPNTDREIKPINRDSVGRYSFNYNFDEGGLYTVKISASSPTYGPTQLNNGLGVNINIKSKSGEEIPENPDEPDIPDEETAEPSLMPYIIGFVLIVAVGFGAFKLFKRK